MLLAALASAVALTLWQKHMDNFDWLADIRSRTSRGCPQ